MSASETLLAVLERARTLGILGPGPVSEHVDHAQGFLLAIESVPAGARLLDLGSGAGVPGLVIAEARPDLRITLLDAMQKRVALLDEAIISLGVSERVTALVGRAELIGRDPAHRGAHDVVTARSFGPPATVAECAAPLLRVGGLLVVSEPPDRPDRWPAEPLREFGLGSESSAIEGIQVLRQMELCTDRFPRRDGMPAKRPRF